MFHPVQKLDDNLTLNVFHVLIRSNWAVEPHPTTKYIKNANEEGDIIVTRNGLPYAIISRIDGSELEDYVLAKHFDLEEQFKSAKREYASGNTTNAHDLLKMIDREK